MLEYTFVPAARNRATTCGSQVRPCQSMQSARSATRASISLVAATPIGSIPARSPASRPSFSSWWTRTPATWNAGSSASRRMTCEPTPPV